MTMAEVFDMFDELGKTHHGEPMSDEDFEDGLAALRALGDPSVRV